jgi:hypothetical protein
MCASRITESDLVSPALRLAAERPDGFISTSDLVSELENIFNPGGRDAEIIDGRSDTFFSQKVRNMISHRYSSNSFIYNGYADYDEERRGLRITDVGRELLRKLSGD